MSDGPPSAPFLCLIAPNISEQMGGEAMMALQIYDELTARGVPVHQITHSRVRHEIERTHPELSVSYVEDDWLDRVLCRNGILRMIMGPIFMWKAARLARKIIAEHPGAIVHYTSPVSPVVPMFRTEGAPVIVGPINGNIHYPPAFRDRESPSETIRRLLLRPVQLLHRAFFPGKRKADVLLVDGGERTRRSLRFAGCREEQFRDSLTCGIPNGLRDLPPIEHRGRNLRFVHNGRLMPHKGVDLIIKGLARTKNRIELDVIGRGTERTRLERLAVELGVQDRVRFIDWFSDLEARYDALRAYRAFVFPSLAEAHGIVVQEAMMMGLPVICVNWGGPGSLVTPETGILIEPKGEEDVVAGLAEAMDRLAEDGDLAEGMARAGRERAIADGFSWSDIIDEWIALYHELQPSTSPAKAPESLGPVSIRGDRDGT